MNPLRSILAGALALLAAAITVAQDGRPGASQPAPAGSRFEAVDITIDSADKPLAAYQFELTAAPGSPRITLVGVEGGEHAAFGAAPYYDPKALAGDRVIVAAFSTNSPANLPSGKTRVARLHLRIEGPGQPEYQVTLKACGDSQGTRINATAAAAASGENR